MSNVACQLQYGRSPTMRWGRWFQRAALMVSILVGARASVPIVQQYRSRFKLQAQRQALFQQCLRHVYPTETMVFDEATDAAHVPAYDDSRLESPPRPPARPIAPRLAQPIRNLYWPDPRNRQLQSAWDALASLELRWEPDRIFCAHGLRPAKIYSQVGANGEDWADEVFAHGRRCGNGPTRLVLIGFDPPAFVAGSITPFRAQVVGLRSAPFKMRWTSSRDAFGFRFECPPNQSLRLYAGQADPMDESHFTIRYETPSGSGVIDGWLRPDDTVKLRTRYRRR